MHVVRHIYCGQPKGIINYNDDDMNVDWQQLNNIFSLTDIDILPAVHLNLTANRLVISDNISISVTCISSLNSSSTLNWHRVSGTQQQSSVNGTILTTTNMISKLQLTITTADLKDAQSGCVAYYCSAHNSLGTVRSRSLSLCQPCECMKNTIYY